MHNPERLYFIWQKAKQLNAYKQEIISTNNAHCGHVCREENTSYNDSIEIRPDCNTQYKKVTLVSRSCNTEYMELFTHVYLTLK